MKAFLILALVFVLAGCGKTTLVQNVEIQKVKIPDELLELNELKKPVAKNELDILNAYSSLFYEYKKCEIKIRKIKELNDGF